MAGRNVPGAAEPTLRQRAEALLRRKPEECVGLAPEVWAVLQELDNRQRELERQNAELRESRLQLAAVRDRYADMYDFAPFGYVTLTEDGCIGEANVKAAELFGMPRETLPHRPVAGFLSSHSLEAFAYLQREALASPGVLQTCELELDLPDGTMRVVRAECCATGTASGLCRCALVDVTELKAAERQLQGSRASLRLLNETLEQQVFEQTREIRLLASAVSHLGEGVMITSDDLDWPLPKILFVNEAMCRISGYTSGELIGQAPQMLHGRVTDAAAVARIKAELAAGNSAAAELVNYRKDGMPYYAEIFITAILNETGNRTNFVSIYRDITERKRAEVALRKSHKLLERRVAQRTAELGELNRNLERANAVKTRFLTAVSHDLRQPLQAIELYLSVLARQFGEPELQDVYKKIRTSLSSMSETLNNLLDLSRFESGTMSPAPADFPVGPLLNRIVVNNQPQAVEKGLRIDCEVADCVLHSDPELLGRVVENFVSNAIRYTDEGGVTIRCLCGPQSARITVSDTGRGIAEADREVIFDAYRQLNDPVRERRKGFGLGLSIVKFIADLLGCPLTVESVPGTGSTFAIEVPLGYAAAEPAAGRPEAEPVAERKRNGLILVVEDDRLLSFAMELILQSVGYQVAAVTNGDEALQWLAAGHRPQITICDYRLPGGDGIGVIGRIRRAVGDDSLPALLFTGDLSDPEIRKQAAANFSVLHKGVETETLLACIEKLFAENAAAGQGGTDALTKADGK